MVVFRCGLRTPRACDLRFCIGGGWFPLPFEKRGEDEPDETRRISYVLNAFDVSIEVYIGDSNSRSC